MADTLPQGSPLTGFLIDRMDEITPGASALALTTISIRVNVSGNVKVRFARSSADVTIYMLAGVDYGYRLTYVYATGTDAAVITGKIFGSF